MKNFEANYKELLLNVLKENTLNKNRTGDDSYSSFALNLKHDLNNGFPLLTSKKMFLKNFIHELIWFINGDTNINYLKQNNVNIWDKWADKNNNLGPTYGYQLRNFNGEKDQLKDLIFNLKNDKTSRRHLITLWNPLQLNLMALPPCYHALQFYVDNNDNLSLNVSMRSGDLFIGVPYDFALLSALLLVVAKETNLKAKFVNLNITDCHIYKNHLYNVIDYINLPTHDLPQLNYIGNINNLQYSDFTLINYNSEKFIKTQISI
jgi:thymidylate synthase